MAWVPYVGPEGGEGWQDAESGDVVYQEDAPGEAVGEELQNAETGEILDAVAEVFDSESAEELEEMGLAPEEMRLAVQELAGAEELQAVSEAVGDSGDNAGPNPHAADGSEDDEPVREALEEAVGGKYDGEEAEVGDTVYEVDHDKGRGWYAREATVTEVKEGASGISVDMDYAEGGSKDWQTARLLYGPAGGEGSEEPEEPEGPEDDGPTLDVEALAEADPSDPSSVVEALDIDYADRTEFRELGEEQQVKLRDGLAEVYGDVMTDSFYGKIDEWKAGSGGTAGKWLESTFDGALDLPGENFRGEHLPQPKQEKMAAVMQEVSERFVEEEFGGELEMHRGISEKAWEKYQDEGADGPVEMSSMAIGSFGRETAQSFADKHGTATVSWSVPAEDVVFAMDSLTSFTGDNTMMEAEMQVAGGEVVPEEVNPA